MPTSITKYQIPPSSSQRTSPPPPSFNEPLPPKEVLKISAPALETPMKKEAANFISNVVEGFKENPLTKPIPAINYGNGNSSWKTHVGIAIAAFFLGASVAIILMLYLY